MPHSGEKIPDECEWLLGLPETTAMCDVDRYIDRIYQPTLEEFLIVFHKTEWHRYAVDLNRIPEDVDSSSVVGSLNKPGTNNRGFHWVETTLGQSLMTQPMSFELHQNLKQKIYDPFHLKIRNIYQDFFKMNHKNIYHLDAHSMPSVGTSMHRDPGQIRADIVISDSLGKSCSKKFRDLVIAAYVTAGFKLGYNWPYVGGRLTEQYGQPEKGQHTIQVELNRALYMDENTKKLNEGFEEIRKKIAQAISYIKSEIPNV